MGSKTTKTKEQAVTTPNVPSYAQAPIEGYFGQVGNFLKDPSAAMPQINSLQQGAFNSAGLLDGSPSDWNAAMTNTMGAAGDLQSIRGPQVTTANQPATMDAAFVSSLGPRNVSQASMGTLGPAAMAQAANAGNASQVGLKGYDPTQAQTRGYDASLVGDIGKYLDGSVERVQGQSLLDNLQGYMNPYLSQVVDTTAADFDDYASQQRAAMQADAARTGAFGGSRAGIARGQMEGDLARGRASTLAGLRSDAFNTGAGLSNLDAGRRQEAGMFNAGAQNERDLARGQLGMQGALANQGATNQARAFGANAFNEGQFFNAGAANEASQFGANAFNRGQEFNAGANNDFALQNAGFQQQTNLANAGAQNQFGLERFGAENAMNQFNAGSQNEAFGQQYGVDAQKAQQDAAALNAMRSQIYGTQADLNQFNAGQANQMGQFNAGLEMDKVAQTLAAMNQYGNMTQARDAGQRADLGLQADLGNQQYQLQLANSPYGQMLAAQGLLDPSLIQAVSGQTINSSGTQKTSGGLGGALMGGLFSLGSAAIGKYSDRRLKTNIVKLGELEDGLGVYEFDYIWGEPDVGVMADEVAQLRPWALGAAVGGFATVHYEAL